MTFDELQLEALQKARKILEEVGLLKSPPSSPLAELTYFKQIFELSQDSNSEVSSVPSTINYIASPAAPYTSEDIHSGHNRTTYKARAQKFIQHPENAIVEYPETGSFNGEAIVHIFPLPPGTSQEDFDPKLNIQYGIWGKHGSRPNVRLFLFPQEDKSFPLCSQFKAECMAVKKCSYLGHPDFSSSILGGQPIPPFVDSAEREVFMKTLGLFCALMQNGCLFNPEIDNSDSDDEEENEEDVSDTECTPKSPLLFYEALCDICSIKGNIPRCKGKLIFRKDKFGHSFIQCGKRRKGHLAHLIIHNLNEINLEYLHALLEDNLPRILEFEKQAAGAGYGPLFPCNFISGTREQKELCVDFYRTKDGILKRGQMVQSQPCSAHFEVYYPNDTSMNPWIVMVCCNPHSHPYPHATRTPRAIEELSNSLLNTLGWKLADATPRKIILDAAFMTGLHKILCWDGLRDPSLSDLHPSLGNFDHTARLINKLRLEQFPDGTGFEAVVVARAFTTSQSAAAHHIRFKRIFEIVKADTGQQVQFRHIHGTGWDTIIADEHRGQALGLGLYLQDICRNMAGYCSVDWKIALHALKPYDHTKRCLHICFQHFSTCVRSLKPHVSTEVYGAMMSFYSPDPIPDYEATVSLIQRGGKRAADWMKDKLSADKSILAAIYRPESKIPLDIWKASPNTTNGNEQAHCNIYRDGIKMSLVPGAIRSFQFDSRSMVTLELFQEQGIHPCDRLPTYYLRSSRAVIRSKKVQERTVQANDDELQKTYTQMSKLQDKFTKQTNSLKRMYTLGKDTEAAIKRVCTTEKQLEGLRANVSTLQDRSSGTVPIPDCLAVQNSQPEQLQSRGSSIPNTSSIGNEPHILLAPAHLPGHVNRQAYQTIPHVLPNPSQWSLPPSNHGPHNPTYHIPQHYPFNSFHQYYPSPVPPPHIVSNGIANVHPWIPSSPNVPAALYSDHHSPWMQNPYPYPYPSPHPP
ncbi:hypothetical protein M422DRAFT_261437 [Sphaerobolus stellatus SS14]|uniref:Uncharacterized protein n=1 Tax=Sphaerobolus stellatus (strain SS14) TaxID=990650 RepID=A0A0C9VF98_SPHS4|nr:hypothetical protein M422DRAFT_261437 [Sphaerobolus stellatus SS14]